MHLYLACHSGLHGPLLTGPLGQESQGLPRPSGLWICSRCLAGPRGRGQTRAEPSAQPESGRKGARPPPSPELAGDMGGAGESTPPHWTPFLSPVLPLPLDLELHHPVLFILPFSTPPTPPSPPTIIAISIAIINVSVIITIVIVKYLPLCLMCVGSGGGVGRWGLQRKDQRGPETH